MTADVYNSIVKYLKDLNSKRHVSSYPRKVQKIVKRKGYCLINYPMLGLVDVLCVSTSANNVIYSLFFISVLTVTFNYQFLKYFCDIVKFVFQGRRHGEARDAPPIFRLFFFLFTIK